MKVYFDNCCLNRPFDDQTQLRIHHVRFVQDVRYGKHEREQLDIFPAEQPHAPVAILDHIYNREADLYQAIIAQIK